MSSTPHDAHQPGSWDLPEDASANPALDPPSAPGAEETPVWSPLEDRSELGESAGSALEPRAQDAPRSIDDEVASEGVAGAGPHDDPELTEAAQAPVGEEPVAAPGSSAYSYPGTGGASAAYPSSGDSYAGYPSSDATGSAAASAGTAPGQAAPSSADAPPVGTPYGQPSAADAAYGQSAAPAGAPYGAPYGQPAAAPDAGHPYGQTAGAIGAAGAAYGQPAGAPGAGYGQPVGAAAAAGGTSRIVAGLLGILLGGFGVHRFVMGYTTIGIIQILVTVVTCGAGSLWGLIEGILILVGAEGFTRDAQGRPLTD